MDKILADVHTQQDSDVLVGIDTGDDSGVYRLSDEQALVVTGDWITPPVDDPYTFGQIAAANALSDIYAMGARPITALNLLGLPGTQDVTVFQQVLAGGLSKISEAGAILIGGHTTDDPEPKYGLSVNGLVHPDRILRNSTAQPGDRLILTKPLGTGVIINGNNAGKTLPENLEPVIESMITLNRVAAEVLTDFTVHACTDVTGFGLAGHAGKMAATSGVTMRINLESLPFFTQAQELYYDKVGTGANKPNYEKVASELEFNREISWKDQQLLYDPQTSGGLLIAVAGNESDRLLQSLLEHGVKNACLIGEITGYDGKGLRIV